MKYLALALFLSLPAMADVAPPPPAPAAQHPQGIEKAQPSQMGVITGGWAYVYAAYGAGVFGVIAYAASLFVRRQEGREGPPPGAP